MLDRSRSDCGGFVSQGMAWGTGLSSAASLGYAYLLAGSRHYRRSELLERVLLAAEFGRFNLVITNFDSVPDTGFLVKVIAPVLKAARQAAGSGDAGAGEIVRTAAPGMASGGFHTPNHRWVLVAALSQALELFPDLDVMDTIEAYLAETIDINADGEDTERSTGV